MRALNKLVECRITHRVINATFNILVSWGHRERTEPALREHIGNKTKPNSFKVIFFLKPILYLAYVKHFINVCCYYKNNAK